jgi:AraC family transcriptional activator of pobA
MLATSFALVEKELEDSFYIKYYDGKCDEPAGASRLTYNRVLLIKSGNGDIRIDENIFQINPNVLFLIAKGK